LSKRLHFKIISDDPLSKARAGCLETSSGIVPTPAFMAVGTQATVKTLDARDIKESGCVIILANAYHLSVRPGEKLIHEQGGLHQFMKWDGPILTDSGGYQLFSLSSLAKVFDDGIKFRNHLDGDEIFLTPQKVIEIQKFLAPDIAMVIDEPLSFPHTRKNAEIALSRTLRWAEISLEEHKNVSQQLLFCIVQGGSFLDLRCEAAEELVKLSFDGYALGGLSLGEPKTKTLEIIDSVTEILPKDKPRYVMGMGTPGDIIRCVSLGVDMFDCVIPTRHARRGNLFTWKGRMSIKRSEYIHDNQPIDLDCGCETCKRSYSRSYLRHLFQSKEPLGQRLMSIHNLFFYQELMKKIRGKIQEGNFQTWLQENLKEEIFMMEN
tara:strand:- start:15963 stop:17096 length:1134 start_codon:yes stop_codon:yes gene_type:complete